MFALAENYEQFVAAMRNNHRYLATKKNLKEGLCLGKEAADAPAPKPADTPASTPDRPEKIGPTKEERLEALKERLADVVSSQVAKMLDARVDTLEIERAILEGLDRACLPRGVRATQLTVTFKPDMLVWIEDAYQALLNRKRNPVVSAVELAKEIGLRRNHPIFPALHKKFKDTLLELERNNVIDLQVANDPGRLTDEEREWGIYDENTKNWKLYVVWRK